MNGFSSNLVTNWTIPPSCATKRNFSIIAHFANLTRTSRFCYLESCAHWTYNNQCTDLFLTWRQIEQYHLVVQRKEIFRLSHTSRIYAHFAILLLRILCTPELQQPMHGFSFNLATKWTIPSSCATKGNFSLSRISRILLAFCEFYVLESCSTTTHEWICM